MNVYDEEYYVTQDPSGEDHIFPEADEKTALRKYSFLKMPAGGPPLYFHNGYVDRDKRKGVVRPITDVLFVGSNLIVSNDIREKLITYPTFGLQINSAVYVDDDGKFHESYWFLTFYDGIACLSKNKTKLHEVEDEDDDVSGEVFNSSVDKYSLDEAVLDAIPEEERLLFKIPDVSLGYIFVHKKIVDFFEANNFTGIRFFKVSKFEEGDQYP